MPFFWGEPTANSSTTLLDCGSNRLTMPFSAPTAQTAPSAISRPRQKPFPSSIVAETWFVLGSIRTKFPSCSFSTQSDPSPYVREFIPLRGFSPTVAIHLPVPGSTRWTPSTPCPLPYLQTEPPPTAKPPPIARKNQFPS